jgi:hypothetical protein
MASAQCTPLGFSCSCRLRMMFCCAALQTPMAKSAGSGSEASQPLVTRKAGLYGLVPAMNSSRGTAHLRTVYRLTTEIWGPLVSIGFDDEQDLSSCRLSPQGWPAGRLLTPLADLSATLLPRCSVCIRSVCPQVCLRFVAAHAAHPLARPDLLIQC